MSFDHGQLVNFYEAKMEYEILLAYNEMYVLTQVFLINIEA